jgi:nucleoside-diphosphate-sugar epimerase
MPRTLVTGATGFLGSRVMRLLVERGDDVWATVRARSDTRADEHGVPGERYIPGNRNFTLDRLFNDLIVWYRERDGERPSPPGARQPVARRVAGAFARRMPLGQR